MSVEIARKLIGGWPMVRLGDLATYINGRPFKPSDWGTVGLPIIRIQNLTDPLAHFNRYMGPVSERNFVRDGDLLVSWSASLDAFIWRRGDAILNQHIFKVEEDASLVDRQYLYFALREVMGEIRKQTHGATMKHINKPEFEAFEIPLPPILEQQRIAKALKRKLAAIEGARRASAERVEAAWALPAAYLREVFESEEARKWPDATLGEVVDEFRYGTSNKSMDTGYVTLRIPNVIGNTLDLREIKTVPVTPAELDRLRLVDRDLLFVRTNGSPDNVGRCAVFQSTMLETQGIDSRDVIYASYLIRARPKHGMVSAEFLQYYFQSDAGRESILENCVTTAGQYNINTQGLAGLRIPLPALVTQEVLLKDLRMRCDRALTMQRLMKQELTGIESLPASLLRQAFSGAL